MKLGRAYRLMGTAVALALVLCAFVGHEAYLRATGVEAVLALQGVDPRDLLTGHSVALSLRNERDISTPCGSARERKPQWLALERTGGVDQVVQTVPNRTALAGRRGLIGRASCGRIDIGVSRFHADQTTAEAIAADLQSHAVNGSPTGLAVVSIGSDGRARLKSLIVDHRRYDLDWLR